ncbi:hypothetical protein Shyhy01_05940 [Streptomyces hygroscopicus subsp. hygroscopicus]|nr:hypothetical protein Shyhy01_05940 [Streptomyces hygroscopicus subsp. hygroscopicus]
MEVPEAARLGVPLLPLDDLPRTSDVVTLHAPQTPATRHLIGAREPALMPADAVLVGTARGALVDHEALVAELRTGRLSAVLDVTDPEPLPADSPLFDLPNVLLTPRLAGSQGNEVARPGASVVEEAAWSGPAGPGTRSTPRRRTGRPEELLPGAPTGPGTVPPEPGAYGWAVRLSREETYGWALAPHWSRI